MTTWIATLWMTGVALAVTGSGWKTIETTDGITVMKRPLEGRDLPEFAAVGEVKADIHHVLAVVADADRQHEWLPQVGTIRVMKRVSPFEVLVYTRMDAPWPASDREVVSRNRIVVIDPGRVVELRIEDERLPAPADLRDDDLVRIPHLEAVYRLEKVGPRRTRVEYRVDSTPGGSLPGWLAEQTSEDLPLETLQNLRAQVRKTRGQYTDFIERWGEGPPTGAPRG